MGHMMASALKMVTVACHDKACSARPDQAPIVLSAVLSAANELIFAMSETKLCNTEGSERSVLCAVHPVPLALACGVCAGDLKLNKLESMHVHRSSS
jgi:hypothetical protein